MTQDAGFHPEGSFPRNHVVAVIDNLQEAEQAAQALQNAGYNAKDIHLIRSQDFVEGLKETQQKASVFAKMVHTFQATSDEGFAGDMYVHQAQQGHQVLAVYVPKAEQVDPVRDIIAKYHAHLIRYFGLWSIRDLP